VSFDKEIIIVLINSLTSLATAYAWPFTVLLFFCLFRKEVRIFISGIKNIKYPGGEISTQLEDPDAPEPTIESSKQAEIYDPRGFRTEEGLRLLVMNSHLVERGEEVKDVLLLFHTERQKTWLISTNNQMFCVLDDEKTRAKSRLIQWRIAISEIDDVKAYLSKKENNVVDIGPKHRWLYSGHLHADPIVLEDRIWKMINNKAV
jgi:hypothetical protein